MFKRILVPLDLTDRHQPVLATAGNLAKQGGEVTLLHVIEAIPGLPDEELTDFYKRIEQTAGKHLERLGQQLTGQQIPWHSKILIGSRVEEVVQFAVENQADLILLTAPQIDPANPAGGWGSLSWKITMLASCPVLLVKNSAAK